MDTSKVPSPRELQLLALVVSERIGREIVKHYESKTGKRLPYGTAYTLLNSMAEAGWISSKDDIRNGRRVRRYQIQSGGSKALNRARDYYRGLADFSVTAKGEQA